MQLIGGQQHFIAYRFITSYNVANSRLSAFDRFGKFIMWNKDKRNNFKILN